MHYLKPEKYNVKVLKRSQKTVNLDSLRGKLSNKLLRKSLEYLSLGAFKKKMLI